jgi:hypothetical protein
MTKPNEPLLVYVAAASAELERAERVMKALRAAGIAIANDWTPDVRRHREAGLTDGDLTDEQCGEISSLNLEGVRKAGVLLFLTPKAPSAMAWVELGCASNVGHLIFASGPSPLLAVRGLADFIFQDDDEAIAALTRAKS